MFRRLAPKSLGGRALLIVALPIFAMQLIVTSVFFNRHWETVTGALSRQTVSEMSHILALWQDPPEGLSRAKIEEMAADNLKLYMRWAPGQTIPERNKLSFFSPPNRTLEKELERAIDAPVWLNTRGYSPEVEVRIQLTDGYLVFVTPREEVIAQNGHVFVIWLIGTTGLIGYIASVFMRNQVRSITRLADAAEAFGRGDDLPDYRPTGAQEVRQAGQAFMAMRARIKRYLHQRTAMLAGVSHDLRTPLTRMKLGIAMLPEGEDRTTLDADAKEMELMLEAYLAFVRDSQDEGRTLVDVNPLTKTLKDEFDRLDQRLTLKIEEDLTVHANDVSLKRALNNLCTNAFKYGTKVQLSGYRRGGSVVLQVEDDGPGIPPQKREQALQPFERLDNARTTPGTGLGLAIVQDIVRRHGGRLELDDSPMGGLCARISLPG